MSLWILLQIGLNLIFGLGIFLVFQRLNKPAKDDPRLSRGLQLLQSKIAILEDLSDRTEVQVNQLTALLEQKCKDVQGKIHQAERHVQLINASMSKSLEVAKIFQDKIPHQEIIERQNTLKYVQAARMAHQGLSVEQIREKVDLPLGEVEFITKVNREQLMFAEDELPAWAQEAEETSQEPAPTEGSSPQRDLSQAFDVPRPQFESLEKLGEQFRKACEDFQPQSAPQPQPAPVAMAPAAPPPITQPTAKPVAPVTHIISSKKGEPPVIRKVEFPRIEVPDELA